MTSSRSRTHARERRQRTPSSLVYLRAYFAVVGRVLPGLAARTAYRLWFRTRRFPAPPRESRWRAPAHDDRIGHETGSLATITWGTAGPTVLLVHGWNGRASQMGAFAQPLVDAGFRVVAFDLPAHGRSPGNSTNVFRVIDALETVATAYGPVHGVIAHSFGVIATTLALADRMDARAVVCISSPTSLRGLADRFVHTLRAPPVTAHTFLRRVERDFGADIWDRVALDQAAMHLTTPALIVHDEGDSDVPFPLAQKLAAAWPGSTLMKTQGLGHRRILRDPRVVEAAVRFLREHTVMANGP